MVEDGSGVEIAGIVFASSLCRLCFEEGMRRRMGWDGIIFTKSVGSGYLRCAL
jgi:hypothetical protein